MSHDRYRDIDRRRFLKLMGMTALATSTTTTSIARALEIPANNAKGSIEDVQHIIVLMQENTPFDQLFGTLNGVRGFSDPRAVNINLPLQGPAGGSTLAPVFLQPAPPASSPAYTFSVPSGTVGGPSNGVPVVPPFHINPASVSSGLANLGGTYLTGPNHDWASTHDAWNNGQYDSWASVKGVMAMSYLTRDDAPYHYALADAFTVADHYFSSLMGPTVPNRYYHWTGCIGNVNYLANGTDGDGAGPVTYNGLSPKGNYFVWETFPEVLQAAGIKWKIYQDLAGTVFSPDFGGGTEGDTPFAGTFTDNPMLYFSQYASAIPGSPLFDRAAKGTTIIKNLPTSSAPPVWQAWAESLFSDFLNDVQNDSLPQVSWIVAPAGYCEHPDWPRNYGAWFISQVLNILVSNPAVFSKTVLIVNYDEADGAFDHLVPPSVPQALSSPSGALTGASTVSIENEIVPSQAPESQGGTSGPAPIGLGMRVPLIAISPWSKGGYVNSQVFDHTSVIQFIEKRFGVTENNLSPWRRAVAGDLTSLFNFTNPNAAAPKGLPDTSGDLPSVAELGGSGVDAFTPGAASDVSVGVPTQEKGIRHARALPYALDVQAFVNASTSTVGLEFFNTGTATAVFHVRSGNPTDFVRYYTVSPGLTLSDTWNVSTSTYNLSVYGPNGFVRYFNGSIGSGAAALAVAATYYRAGRGSIGLKVTNAGNSPAHVSVFHGYTNRLKTYFLKPQKSFTRKVSLHGSYGWYDLILTVAGDQTFQYRLGGHVETGKESYSDPAVGGFVTLKS